MKYISLRFHGWSQSIRRNRWFGYVNWNLGDAQDLVRQKCWSHLGFATGFLLPGNPLVNFTPSIKISILGVCWRGVRIFFLDNKFTFLKILERSFYDRKTWKKDMRTSNPRIRIIPSPRRMVTSFAAWLCIRVVVREWWSDFLEKRWWTNWKPLGYPPTTNSDILIYSFLWRDPWKPSLSNC